MTDTLLPSREYFMGSKGPFYVLSEEFAYSAREKYLTGEDAQQPYASPYFATYQAKMPPMFLITATCDPLRDEGELFAKKMMDSGIHLEHIRFQRMFHGFVSFYKVVPKGKKAIRQSVKFTNKYF